VKCNAQACKLVGPQGRENTAIDRRGIGGVIGTSAGELEPRDVGKVLDRSRRSEILDEIRERIAVQ